MKRVGIVSYNMYGNFTNYGSALQTFALHKTINELDPINIESVVMDYCPDVLLDKDVLNPMRNMWDQDRAALERCILSLPAIRENYDKFKSFYNTYYNISKDKYTSSNFNDSLKTENLNGYVCGSDTVFAVPEFGFDDGFYANYDVMRGRSIAYAASFGDYDIPESDIPTLEKRLSNFKAIALRENEKKVLVQDLIGCRVDKVIDPTLLQPMSVYDELAINPHYEKPYLLLYSRRGDTRMQDYAEDLAKMNGWDVVEISLNAENARKNIMRYDAGVEEFLGLVKHAQMVITNSYHGMIFAVHFKKPFYVFSRKLCDTKIKEALELFGLSDRLYVTGDEPAPKPIEYDDVHGRIAVEREKSKAFLKKGLELLVS